MHGLKRIIFGMAAIVVLGVSPVMAQDNSFKVFVTANWISPLSSEDVTFGSVSDSISAANALGYEGGVEWRLNKIIGLEGSYLIGSNDVDFGSTNIGTLDSSAITAAINIHFLPTKYFDFWAAPVASWYHFDDFELDSSVGGGSTTIDSQWGYGAAVGFDIGFGKTFAITAGVRYVKLSVSGDSSSVDSVDINPLISRVGLAFRFGTR
jgi:hypothetical protein